MRCRCLLEHCGHCEVRGGNIRLPAGVDHLVCYELDSELVEYLNNDEESNETSLPRTTRMELLGALDEIVGEHQAYWSFWAAEESDDVVEIYGGFRTTSTT